MPDRTSRADRVREVLSDATARLRQCLEGAPGGSGETPYLDALLLLGQALGEPVERILASLPDQVDPDALERYERFLTRRCRGVPVSYIRGTKEFYGREFCVTPAVLVPRPDSETLIEAVFVAIDDLERQRVNGNGAGPLHVHDACTGSGCIAITVAAERPGVVVSASDIDEAALDVARRNAERMLAGIRPEANRVRFWKSDLLSGIPDGCTAAGLQPPGIIAANPPYLTDTQYRALRTAHWPEPPIALRGGPDGLDPVRGIVRQAVTVLAPGGYLLLEIGCDQATAALRVLEESGFVRAHVEKDLAGRDRMVTGQRPAP